MTTKEISENKTRKKNLKTKALKTIEDAAEAESRISELIRMLFAHENAFAEEHERLNKNEEALTDPLRQEIIMLGKSIYDFAEKNRDELTQNGKKKTVTMPLKAGLLQWYRTPSSVKIENAKEVLGRIKTLGFKQFIRTKEEINKEALLEDEALARTINGVTITSQEKFAIRPIGVKERVECTIPTKRWKITAPSSK